MTDTVLDIPVSLLPLELWSNVAYAAKQTVSPLDLGDGRGAQGVSSYKYLEELATNPAFQGAVWKQALVTAGVGVGGMTVGFGTLIAATGPLAPFTALAGMIAAPFFGGNRCATIIICNGTEGDLKLLDTFQDCGVQTARPSYAAVDPDTGNTLSTSPDTIPGVTTQIPGLVQLGIGMYRFEKNLDMGIGFYGTGGAISFTFSDPDIRHTMALSWLVPETGSAGIGVTDNINKYKTLEDFYHQTAGARKAVTSEDSPGTGKIWGSGLPRGYPEVKDKNDLVFTVLITK